MMTATRRVVLAVVAGGLLAAAAVPAPAQQTTETTTSFAADSSSAGLFVAVTPPGEQEPAVAVVGAGTEGSITSDGPAAAGQADALALAGESLVGATTSAPPDETDSAQSPIDAIVTDVATIGALQGEASSASEAQDGLPSTDNDASFSGVEIDLALPELGPLGTVGGSVTVASASTHADAAAAADTDVGAEAGSSGIAIGLDVEISVLEQLCASLPAGPLQDACNSVAQQDAPVLADVSVGVSEVSCGWDGDAADCDGSAALVVIELLGQDPVEVAPGQTVTIPDEGPFLIRASSGTFAKETGSDPDSASAIATGVSVELLGQDPALPGLLTVQLGQSTAAVSGEVQEKRIIARTGAPLAPIFLGGSALVAAGLGLRRFLRRR